MLSKNLNFGVLLLKRWAKTFKFISFIFYSALLHFRTLPPPIVIDDSSWKNAAKSFTVALTLTLGGYESVIAPFFQDFEAGEFKNKKLETMIFICEKKKKKYKWITRTRKK